jgi:hypothetical protein
MLKHRTTYRGVDSATSITRAVHLGEGEEHGLMGHFTLGNDFESVARARKVYDAATKRRGRSRFCRGSGGRKFFCGIVHVRVSVGMSGFGGESKES